MFCHKLAMLYEESHLELGLHAPNRKEVWSAPYALYPKRYYEHTKLSTQKKYDFAFIGKFRFTGNKKEPGYNNRKWTIKFAKTFFTNNSFFLNTTYEKNSSTSWNTLGHFDKTQNLSKSFLCPQYMKKESRNKFDENYFDVMSKSKFCLCPAGDASWSMRFYEALMCKCIPIVDNINETFRSKQEAKLNYKYYTTKNKSFEYNKSWVTHNHNLFLKHHTLKYYNNNYKIQ